MSVLGHPAIKSVIVMDPVGNTMMKIISIIPVYYDHGFCMKT